METPFFFNNNNYCLFGVLHEPDPKKLNELSRPTVGIVFCHPFAEEKVVSHRILVNLARGLTCEGFYCLRFDYMGHGDSEGNFEDATVNTRISDILSAVTFLRCEHGIDNVVLLGIRFGATLAFLSAEEEQSVNKLILIQPVVNCQHYILQSLRSNLSMQLATHKRIIKDRQALIKELNCGKTVNIDGYPLTATLFKAFEAIDLMKCKVAVTKRHVLLIQVSNSGQKLHDRLLVDLSEICMANNWGVSMKFAKEQQFWKDTKIYNPIAENIKKISVDWLLNKYHNK